MYASMQVPTDVDFRIMLTFLELYQTLLGFVFYKLYADENLVYPPKLDANKDSEAAGIGAFSLQETSRTLTMEDAQPEASTSSAQNGIKHATARDVKKQIKHISKSGLGDEAQDGSTSGMDVDVGQAAVDGGDVSHLIFKDYFFYLSREVTRPTLEFVIRSFGGQVGWDATLGSGSPLAEDDARITHHVVDRPLPEDAEALGNVLSARAALGKRAWIQPQWVIDCVNAGQLLATGRYAPGETLPPHLSPFVDTEKEQREGRYVPSEALPESARRIENEQEDMESEPSSSEEEEEGGDDVEEEWGGIGSEAEDEQVATSSKDEALQAAARDPLNESLRHQAELEAEAKGISTADFEAQLAKATKMAQKGTAPVGQNHQGGENMDSIMISGNKSRKAYKHLQMRQQKIASEVSLKPVAFWMDCTLH